MADNINFSVATYATQAMRPDANEELTADWARKLMENTAKAAGYVATFYATNTTVATLGTGYLYFTGFTQPPSLDLWLYERGNFMVQWQDAYAQHSGANSRIVGKQVRWTTSGGTGTLYLEVYPHPAYGVLFGAEDFNFEQGSYGTWIARLRGV